MKNRSHRGLLLGTLAAGLFAVPGAYAAVDCAHLATSAEPVPAEVTNQCGFKIDSETAPSSLTLQGPILLAEAVSAAVSTSSVAGIGALTPFGALAPNDATDFAADLELLPGDPLHVYQLVTTGATSRYDATGASEALSFVAPPAGQKWADMATDPGSGLVYAVAQQCGTASSLSRINLTTGARVAIGNITTGTCVIAIAFDNAGGLYGIDVLNDTLMAINKTNGTSAVVGPLGFDANYAQSMDCDPGSGTCYLFAFNNTLIRSELRSVNLANGGTSLLGVIGANSPGGTTEALGGVFGTIGNPDVPPGLDLFTTPATPVGATVSNTSADFASTPLPPTLFCDPGTAFAGKVYFKGEPFNSIDFRWKLTDTIVRRLDTATLPSNGSSDTVPIEIVALSLVSIRPIAVACPAPNNNWNVRVCLSSVVAQPQGSMSIQRTDSEGGTFTSSLPVYARFTFTNATNAADTRQFDAGTLPAPVLFTTTSGVWSYDAPASLGVVSVPAGLNVDGNCDGVLENLPVGTVNFVVGVARAPYVISGYAQTPVVYSVTRTPTEGEGLLQPDPAHPAPNDMYGLGHGPFAVLSHGGELFQSSGAVLGAPPDKTNVDRMSASWAVGPGPAGGPPYKGPFLPSPGGAVQVRPGGAPPGTLGLVPADEIDALSFGRDGGNVLVFSVRDDANGLAGTDVRTQSTTSIDIPCLGGSPSYGQGNPTGAEVGGDLFSSTVFAPFGGVGGPPFPAVAPFGGNFLWIPEVDLGLQAPANRCSGLGAKEDDLDAVELSDAAVVDVNGDGIPDYGDKLVFFSLGPASPSLGAAGVSVNDILVSIPGFTGSFATYANGVGNIGLLAGDDINALVLSDTGGPGGVPNGVIEVPGDEALFTLAPGSPSLVAGANPNMPAGPHSAGDVFHTGFVPAPGGITLYAGSAALGLDGDDVIDALDIGSTWAGGDPPKRKRPLTKEEAITARHCPHTPQCRFGVSQCENDDRDGDGIPDDADNAPFKSNFLQEDADDDGIGDVSDNCPAVFNPDQRDRDGDHVGDLCDNCQLIYNPTQCDDGNPCTQDSCSDATGCSHSASNCVSFCNAAAVTIPAAGNGAPYPTTINVGGLGAAASVAAVRLLGLSHTFPDDIDLLLVGPGGQNAIVMSDVGGSADVTNISLTLSDSASTSMPDAGPLVTGTFKPTNVGGGDTWSAPAPAPSGGSALSVFTGTNPNGAWSLYVVDQFSPDGGSLANGWCVDLVVAACSSDAQCADGNLCNGVETCVNSSCVAGTPIDCSDGRFCTIDSCAPATGACSHAANSCNDSDSCTVDSCYEGGDVCVHDNVCASFCNGAAVTINDGAAPPTLAAPYPSTIAVAGLGPVLAVEAVQLSGIAHTYPDDVDAFLSGPGGQTAVLMSDVGGGTPVTGVNLKLSDSAAASITDQGQLISGTFKPTNVNPGTGTEAWPAPAPPPAGTSVLSTFNGTNPNGNWNLWVVDDANIDSGNIAGGWCVNIRNACVPTTPVGTMTVTKTHVTWTGGADSYNVYRGSQTPPAAFVYNQTCLQTNAAVSPVPEPASPAPGTLWYYLVSRRSNVCGESVLGTDGNGAPIPNVSPCP